MSNEDLVYSARDCISSIELAESEIDGITEYEDILELLEEAKYRLQEAKKVYEEEYDREQQAELDYQNSEYMRSVI